MMKIKTCELKDKALDWAVSCCEGYTPFSDGISWIIDVDGIFSQVPDYFLDWAHSGPIIEREALSVSYWGERSKFGQHEKEEQFWECRHPSHRTKSRRTAGYGSTPLIAAMRCYVVSKLGEEVEIPDDLA